MDSEDLIDDMEHQWCADGAGGDRRRIKDRYRESAECVHIGEEDGGGELRPTDETRRSRAAIPADNAVACEGSSGCR